MNRSPGMLILLLLVMLIVGALAVLTAAVAGLLARLDGATIAGAVLKAGAAFGASLTVLTGLLLVAVRMLD